jgi:hypothetical protein
MVSNSKDFDLEKKQTVKSLYWCTWEISQHVLTTALSGKKNTWKLELVLFVGENQKEFKSRFLSTFIVKKVSDI